MSADHRLTFFGKQYGVDAPKSRLYHQDPWRSHFSGYPASDFAGSLHDSIGYYLHGDKGAGGHAPRDPEATRDQGMPISGDEVARFSRWWSRVIEWPSYGDVPGLATHRGYPGHGELIDEEPETPVVEQLTLF